jgi:hypothetical protein
MNSRWVVLTISYLVSEALIAFAFSVLAQLLYKKIGFDFKSILKGIVERLFLVICLCNGYHHGLTFFGALKLGTRLKRDDSGQSEEHFNDYYLLGNMLSVAIAIGYVHIVNNRDDIGLLNAIVQ